jgi:glycosyltransferase involved in cell wall biosynthesis
VPLTDALEVSKTGPVPIAVVMTSFEPGGTERQMIELIRRLDPARWTVHVACFRGHGAWFGRVAEAAASVAEFPVESFRRPDIVRHVRAFARWCRTHRFSIVHTTELYSNIFGLPAAALARVPVRIGSRRELNPNKTTAQIALQRGAYSVAHQVVANSRAAAERLQRERVPLRKIALVLNGLDVGRFAARVPNRRLRTVITVANLRAEKGHDVLIEAAPKVLHHFPDAQFEIVGAGPERQSLIERVRARGVEHAFTFLGHREDISDRLAAADLFVLPSRSEAFPNAVLEAMAAGLPIVASAVGGILELIAEDATGLLVPPNDPASLAARICDLMADPSRRERLGAAAAREARSRYSFDRMVAEFDRIYVHQLAVRRARPTVQPQLVAS